MTVTNRKSKSIKNQPTRKAAASTKRKPIRKASRPKIAKTATPAKNAGTGSSKQAAVMEMLRNSKGTTLAAIMKATKWQQHSVRGFLAGTVRKKLGLNLVSEKIDGQRIYRVQNSAAR